MKRCFVCKSDSVDVGATTQTYCEKEHLVVVKQIPCLVCQNCGEEYLNTDVMRTLETFLNKVHAAEVEIVLYEKVAA